MARKNKKRKSNEAMVERSPIVNIKQRDEKLANDLQNLNQKDAIKYSNHLLKLVSGDPEYQDLIFNIPILIHYLKNYELEKKPGGLKNKLLKAGFAKSGALYLLPRVVDGQYIAKAKNIVSKKFNANPNHEDKMALAIARASLEMHGKVVQGVKVPLHEVPLFHIALSASLEIIEKISKGQKGKKDDKDSVYFNSDQSASIFPRWESDIKFYQKKMEDEIKKIQEDSQKEFILDAHITVKLQQAIATEIEKGNLQKEDIEKYIQTKKQKAEIFAIVMPLAKELIAFEILMRRNLVNLYLEKNLQKNFSTMQYQFFAYLFFIVNPDMDIVLPIYINQALLHLNENNFQIKSAEEFTKAASSASSKEDTLLNLYAAYFLGQVKGELVYKMVQLHKDLKQIAEGRLLYKSFLEQEKAKGDKFYKKIQKDWDKNFQK